METRLSLVILGVQDLPRARKFYAEGLGLPLRPESGEEVAYNPPRTSGSSKMCTVHA